MLTTVFDIETREIPFEELQAAGIAPASVGVMPTREMIQEKMDSMSKSWLPETKLKKAEEWAASYSADEDIEKWMKNSQLDPVTSIIAGYGAWVSDDPKRYHIELMSEKAFRTDRVNAEINMLQRLTELLDRSAIAIGHYVRGFDLPFIKQRCVLLDIDFPDQLIRPEHVQENGVETRVYDTCEHYQGRSKSKSSLEYLGLAMGKGRKPLHATELWSAPLDTQQEYVAYDVEVTLMLARRLRLIEPAQKL